MVLRTLDAMGVQHVSDNNRKAKFYELTPRGRRQIHEETASWELTVALMAKFLAKQAGEP